MLRPSRFRVGRSPVCGLDEPDLGVVRQRAADKLCTPHEDVCAPFTGLAHPGRPAAPLTAWCECTLVDCSVQATPPSSAKYRQVDLKFLHEELGTPMLPGMPSRGRQAFRSDDLGTVDAGGP